MAKNTLSLTDRVSPLLLDALKEINTEIIRSLAMFESKSSN